MKFELLRKDESLPVIATDRELTFHADFLSEDRKAFVAPIMETYGEPKEFVDGDPRKCVASREEVEFMGFFNGQFGIVTEIELAYHDKYDDADTDVKSEEELIALYHEVKADFEAHSERFTTKYNKTEFFCTLSRLNVRGGLVMQSFTPLEANGVVFNLPYDDKQVQIDMVNDMFSILNGNA